MGLTTTEGEEEERRLLTPGGLYLISGAGVCSEGEGAGVGRGVVGLFPILGDGVPGGGARAGARVVVGWGASRHHARGGTARGERGGEAGIRAGVARTSPPKGDPRGGNPPASARALWGRARGGETRRVRRGRGWRSATTARNSRGVPRGEVSRRRRVRRAPTRTPRERPSPPAPPRPGRARPSETRFRTDGETTRARHDATRIRWVRLAARPRNRAPNATIARR